MPHPFISALRRLDTALLDAVHCRGVLLLCVSIGLHDDALISAGGLARVLAPLHLGDHQVEGFLDVLVVPGAGLGPGALEFFGEGFSVFGRDLALCGIEITLVADDDEGNPFRALCD